MSNETDNPVYGRTNNPWDSRRAPGGSSGGEGAAVASGGSVLGLGSDIGGSIRLPAHACGIHAFKPTSGRLTMRGHALVPDGQEAVVAAPGPLARSVADLSVAMRVLAAQDQYAVDPRVPPVPWPDPSDVSLAGLRVAMYTDNGVLEVAPAMRRAVREAAAALSARGVEVEEWQPPELPRAWHLYLGLLFADGMRTARRALAGSKPDWRIQRTAQSVGLPRSVLARGAALLDLLGQRHLAQAWRSLGPRSVDDYWRLLAERRQYHATFIEALERGGFQAIICPPDALPALVHGSSLLLGDALSYAAVYNLLGMPAGVVAATRVRPGEETIRTAGRDLVEHAARRVERGSAGLPIGVQVVARNWRDDMVLAVMRAIEEHFSRQPDYPVQSEVP